MDPRVFGKQPESETSDIFSKDVRNDSDLIISLYNAINSPPNTKRAYLVRDSHDIGFITCDYFDSDGSFVSARVGYNPEQNKWHMLSPHTKGTASTEEIKKSHANYIEKNKSGMAPRDILKEALNAPGGMQSFFDCASTSLPQKGSSVKEAILITVPVVRELQSTLKTLRDHMVNEKNTQYSESSNKLIQKIFESILKNDNTTMTAFSNKYGDLAIETKDRMVLNELDKGIRIINQQTNNTSSIYGYSKKALANEEKKTTYSPPGAL